MRKLTVLILSIAVLSTICSATMAQGQTPTKWAVYGAVDEPRGRNADYPTRDIAWLMGRQGFSCVSGKAVEIACQNAGVSMSSVSPEDVAKVAKAARCDAAICANWKVYGTWAWPKGTGAKGEVQAIAVTADGKILYQTESQRQKGAEGQMVAIRVGEAAIGTLAATSVITDAQITNLCTLGWVTIGLSTVVPWESKGHAEKRVMHAFHKDTLVPRVIASLKQ